MKFVHYDDVVDELYVVPQDTQVRDAGKGAGGGTGGEAL